MYSDRLQLLVLLFLSEGEAQGEARHFFKVGACN